VTDLCVHLQHVGVEAKLPGERDVLQRCITREQPGLDPERRLCASQPQHRELGTTRLENPDDSVDAHRYSMGSQCESMVNGTPHAL